jgi:peptide/nickel transport system substrate-binding protein
MKQDSDGTRDRPLKLNQRYNLPFSGRVEFILRSFSPFEKFLFVILILALVLSSLAIVFRVNKLTLAEIPTRGGHIVEGIVRSPWLINPVLATSDADRDVAALIYSGLLRFTPEGEIVSDLADEYRILDDGLSYEFSIRKDATFHDGTPVTAEDVLYTIKQIQNPALKSPKRADWDSVIVEMVSERKVRFALAQPYAPFLENATVGILPKHIWKNIQDDEFALTLYNIEPIGSGPYKIIDTKRNETRVLESYRLEPFENYVLGEPYISKLTLKFYENEEKLIDAFVRGEVTNINGISYEHVPGILEASTHLVQTPLPRIFAVFFNQNEKPDFANKEIRQALELVVNRDQIVKDVLWGYGRAIDGPLPPLLTGEAGASDDTTLTRSTSERIKDARELIESLGWELNADGIYEDEEGRILSFSLSTSDTPELVRTAELLSESWRELGVNTAVKIFEAGDLNSNVIRPRNYDALLFGEIIDSELDLFAFWHSSQRLDPGLNVALYANIAADNLLEQTRTLSEKEARESLYSEFEKIIDEDMPAIFLYSPDFIYIVSPDIRGLELGWITTPGKRFLNIHEWYIERDLVWKFLAD